MLAPPEPLWWRDLSEAQEPQADAAADAGPQEPEGDDPPPAVPMEPTTIVIPNCGEITYTPATRTFAAKCNKQGHISCSKQKSKIVKSSQ